MGSNMDSKEFDLYKDIRCRTNGEIYIGVVGPVRTGKSTFIKHFMELCVIPKMDNEYAKKRAVDELPQSGKGKTIMTILSLTEEKNEYEKIKDAFSSVQQKGYGVVMPQLSDIRMEEPVLIAHGNKFGVKMKAISPSIHMIRANIETEIAPIVGSREQAEDLIDYIKNGENSDSGVWKTNIFGKSVGELMEDGIRSKIMQMDDECQIKLQETMQKIVNDSNGGMICIII